MSNDEILALAREVADAAGVPVWRAELAVRRCLLGDVPPMGRLLQVTPPKPRRPKPARAWSPRDAFTKRLKP